MTARAGEAEHRAGAVAPAPGLEAEQDQRRVAGIGAEGEERCREGLEERALLLACGHVGVDGAGIAGQEPLTGGFSSP